MEMDLKTLLDYVHIMDWNVADSVAYIRERLGPAAIEHDEMLYWYKFYRRIKQKGRRCRCLHSHTLSRSACSSSIYCCERPFELRSSELIVGKNPPRLACEWDVSNPSDFFGGFYPRSERERCCTLDARYVIQYNATLSSVKLFDLYYKTSMSLDYKDSKLSLLSKTRLSAKGSVKISDFQAIDSRRAIMLIRSTDYYENMHRPHFRGARPFASALCLTEISIERGTFKFVDACIIEDHDVVLYNSYDRFPILIGSQFKENQSLGLFVTHLNDQALLRFQVINDRLQIGSLVDILPQEPDGRVGADAVVGDDDDPNGFAHQVIFIPRAPNHHHGVMHINLMNNIVNRHEMRRHRRRQLSLTMHTCIGNKFYGFEYMHNHGVYGTHKHVKLLVDRIHVYDLEDRVWDDLQTESPFPNNKLNVLNYLSMTWRWIDTRLYCAAELEPNRTFVIWFDFETSKWSKLGVYFLDQIYSIVTNYNGDVLAETRHKTVYGGRLLDPLRRRDEVDDGDELPEDTKTYCFYRLNIGQPQSLLTMSFLACRDLKNQHPDSASAKIFDRLTLNESHAPMPRLKKIPAPKPPKRRQNRPAVANHIPQNRRRPLAAIRDVPPLRRSDRLRTARQQRQPNP